MRVSASEPPRPLSGHASTVFRAFVGRWSDLTGGIKVYFAKVIRRGNQVEKSKIAFVVVGAGIAAGLQHEPVFCNPGVELCRTEPAALPDEAPEGLPRGPAPPPPSVTYVSVSSATTSVTINPPLGPHPFTV